MINGNGECRLWQPVQADADSQPKSSGLVLGRRPLGAIVHLSSEPGELSQWLCHDDSTINIVLELLLVLLLVLLSAHVHQPHTVTSHYARLAE